MTARGHVRGWPCEYRGDRWVYTDNGQPIDGRRACSRCGRRPTEEGYDACLGFIPRAVSACCGHGVEKGYTIKKEAKR